VLGNEFPRASTVGEIVPTHEFYSYEAKYLDSNGAGLFIPARNLSPAQMQKIQGLAVQAFRTLGLAGLARVDFFMDQKTGDLYLNEVNTLPGFTSISMYPKMWEASGLAYPQLLNELVSLAQDRHRKKSSLETSFSA
jgi:D-alanine-D-alanine ligase